MYIYICMMLHITCTSNVFQHVIRFVKGFSKLNEAFLRNYESEFFFCLPLCTAILTLNILNVPDCLGLRLYQVHICLINLETYVFYFPYKFRD